jgi:hypothetical protein
MKYQTQPLPHKSLLMIVTLIVVGFAITPNLNVPGVIGQSGKIQLIQVFEFQHNNLSDISADGKLLLFYQTKVPVRSYTLRPGKPIEPNQPEKFDDVLRVVDFATKREVAVVGVNFFPSDARFVPEIKLIFYKEPRKPRTHSFKLWNYLERQVTECSSGDFTGVGHVSFLNPADAIVTMFRDGIGHRVGKISLPDCKLQDFGPATSQENRYDSLRTPTFDLGVSPDKKHIAYEGGKPSAIYIRDTKTFELIKLLQPPEGFYFGSYQLYTPDQKYLLLLGEKVGANPVDFSSSDYYIFFYELPTYKFARAMQLGKGFRQSPHSFALAVSPDSRLLAVSNKKVDLYSLTAKQEQAFLILYDLATGEKLTEAMHPPVKYQRNNPFVANMGRLAFMPDGKHILSSTDDTIVWQIKK